jgi:hypothetical protein
MIMLKGPTDTIVTTIFHPFVARSILYNGILTRLANEGCTILILVPEEKVTFYSALYNHPQMQFVGISISNINAKFIQFIKRCFEYAIHTNIKRYHADEVLARDGHYRWFIFRLALMNSIGRSGLLQNLLRGAFFFLTRNMKTGFEAYITKDTRTVVASDVYNEYDVLLLATAQRRGIRTVGIIRSWDNNISKMLLPVVPDTLVAQSDILREEAMRIHGVHTNISVAGIPYYEQYRAYTPIAKETFFEKLGIPHDAHLILFSPAGNKFIDHDWEFCQILKEAIVDGDLPRNTYVLVRCHPSNTTDLSRFTPNEHFIIETPGTSFGQTRKKDNELDPHSIEHLIDSLHHSSLVINLLSSIIIDAAAVGTPTMMPRFEARFSPSFLRSISRYQKEECMARLLSVWQGSMPRNETEFIAEINRILQGETRKDTEALVRLITTYCPFFEESPSERLFDIIKNEGLNK